MAKSKKKRPKRKIKNKGDRTLLGYHWEMKTPKAVKGAVILPGNPRLTYNKMKRQALQQIEFYRTQHYIKRDRNNKVLLFRVELVFVEEL